MDETLMDQAKICSLRNVVHIKLSHDELLREALDQISNAACFLYEIETPEGRILAVMADTLIRCMEACYKGTDPRVNEL